MGSINDYKYGLQNLAQLCFDIETILKVVFLLDFVLCTYFTYSIAYMQYLQVEKVLGADRPAL